MALRTATSNGMLRIGDPRDVQVSSFEIEREDNLKFKPVYEALHDFLYELGFTHPHSGDDKYEDLYWERWVPSGAKEQHIWWRMKRDINPYIRYFIELNWQTLNVSKTEVAYKNRKVNIEKNDLILRLRAFVQWDMENKFETLPGKVKKVFFHRIYMDELEQHKVELQRIAQRIQGLIKGFAEQTHDLPVEPNFQPVMGYKDPIGEQR